MTTINVQFSDGTQKSVTSIFGCQQDAAIYPNQGKIDITDPRYMTFMQAMSAVPSLTWPI